MEQKRKVLIDGRWAGDTGIGRLYKEVMQAAPPEAACHWVTTKAGLGSMFSPYDLAKDISRSEADIFYSPSFMPPLYSKIPFIFTVHDLMHLFYYSAMHKLYYKHVIARLALRAKQIITVSQFSKEQLVTLLGIPEHLITVIYNGVDAHFLQNEEAMSLNRPYFLYVGNRRTNKNLPAMLEAFAKAKIPDDFIFALSGKAHPALNALIQQLGIEKKVRFLGFIPEEDLPKLYKGAYATLFVSLMEGFGLPVLESMASGTPVITSSVSSLPEIAGGAAVCVNPTKIANIQEGIEQLVNNGPLYEACIEKGIHRAREFPWSNTAQKTWELILT
ncbi:glycosyltransferase family 1 protein [Echinicola strongylocentroti]|uniref:Glycosyltransferase family 1 protein n=1 Tax=Echinicola strongylocentroti TaxID=1795355 RepID=A0A2Z4IGS7_9BACT|nr:glycosyltransferase family 1 protein [Echinicola strongylocentroti]AWW29643.1 glycosyltransferase family 1 protein [Echinicola strongylocentroti]